MTIIGVDVGYNTPLDIKKYEFLFTSGAYKKYFDSFPLIFAVTNKQLPKTNLKVIKFNTKDFQRDETL